MLSEDSKRYGPLRSTAAVKPRVTTQEPAFYAGESGDVFIALNGADIPGARRQDTRDATEVLLDENALRYDIVGGLNENCVRVFWTEDKPQWLCLRTYTGVQYMDLSAKKRPPAVFALAGDDAYAYCDKNPCEMCSFRCKNGFVLYAFFEQYGLVRMELNRIASTQGSLDYRTSTPQRNQ
ncbi:MAG: hypothetical protein ACOX66_04085 [Oscillospiraceae bacterium]|jgi:hypothetical protein